MNPESNEELFERHQAWATAKAEKRLRKLRAILPAHLIPSYEELLGCALSGLWIGILQHKEKGQDLLKYADSKISQEFTWLRRQYGRCETNKDSFEHGSSRDVECIVEKLGRAKR